MERAAKGYVYLLCDDRHYKIGYSTRVRRRVRALQTANPFIRIIATSRSLPCDEARILERTLQNRFAHRHVKGEWFKLDSNDVRYICDTIQRGQSPNRPKLGLKRQIAFFIIYSLWRLTKTIENLLA